MAGILNLSTLESKKTNEQAEQKQTHKYRGHSNGCQMGGGLKGLTSINWQLQNRHGDIKYSIGNIVNNSLIAMYGVLWIRDLTGWSLSKLQNV